jgi:predicted DNA-binding transcriptional regulator AlpA
MLGDPRDISRIVPLQLGLTKSAVARALDVAESTIDVLVAAGEMPPPRRLRTRVVRWSVPELQAWAAAGFPRVADMGDSKAEVLRRAEEMTRDC